MKNHDIAIGEMIDAEDEARIGLLGRDPEIQFVRLAAEYADLKLKLQTARTAISEIVHGRQSMRDYANAVLAATSVDTSNPSRLGTTATNQPQNEEKHHAEG